MIWVCENCNFTFTRVNEPDRCPDCGKQHKLREATEKEAKEFQDNLEKMKSEKW